MLAAEVVPFAKVGGLADVAGALPKALRQLGHDVRVVMPRYGRIDPAHWKLTLNVPPFDVQVGHETAEVSVLKGAISEVSVDFVDIPGLLGNRPTIYGDNDDGRRFLVFCAAALQYVEHIGWKPDVIHANDWHTAIAPAMLKNGWGGTFLADTASIFTIHNLAYQGVVERSSLGAATAFLPVDVHDSWVNIMALGLQHADLLTTVSPTYAHEVLTPEYGAGLEWLLRERHDRLVGVLNGIDTDVFDPETDCEIAANYGLEDLSGKTACKTALQRQAGFSSDVHRPMLGMVGRLVDQKGFDLFAAAVEPLLHQSPLQVVILGTGEPRYHALLEHLQAQYPDRLRAWLTFDGIQAQRIYAGADMFLMPSRFEPCGLGQMIAMRYGTVPIVRGTGGLVDTVEEGPPSAPRTGFIFWPYNAVDLQGAVRRALDALNSPEQWQALVHNDMAVDNSWQHSAQRYIELYAQATAYHRQAVVIE